MSLKLPSLSWLIPKPRIVLHEYARISDDPPYDTKSMLRTSSDAGESRGAQLTAMIEVQATTRKVEEANRRLGALQRSLRVDDAVVEKWVKEDAGGKDGETGAVKKGICKDP